jgi:hypothetical protein
MNSVIFLSKNDTIQAKLNLGLFYSDISFASCFCMLNEIIYSVRVHF